jgi:hypothetical protein
MASRVPAGRPSSPVGKPGPSGSTLHTVEEGGGCLLSLRSVRTRPPKLTLKRRRVPFFVDYGKR